MRLLVLLPILVRFVEISLFILDGLCSLFVLSQFSVYYSSRYKLGVDEIEGMIIDMTNNNTGTTLAIFCDIGSLRKVTVRNDDTLILHG